MPITLPVEEYDRVDWWEGVDLLQPVARELSELLPRGRPWNSEQETWGEEDGDRFDVLRDGPQISEMYGRLDVRRPSLQFLNRIVEIARRHDLLIVTEDRHVLRPTMKELLAAIHRSRSFAFVIDPEGFLNRLADAE